jgi:hypothetical protein
VTASSNYALVKATTLARRFASLVAFSCAVLFANRAADAGIVVSMGDAPELAAPESDSLATTKIDSLLRYLMTPDLGPHVVLTQPNAPMSSSTSSSAPTTFGSGQSPLAIAESVSLGGLPRSGWITPEAVQSLPPLLPSGLFRPPCA